MPCQLLNKVGKTVLKYRMLSSADKVLVAFSGGPDSLALLYVLLELRDKYELSIHVAHLNHMLRGEESERDEHRAEEVCKKLGLPYTIARENVDSLRKKGESLEESARRVRYQFLTTTAQKVKAPKVAVGHTRDDLVETVLMRIIRGTGEEGLAGIPGTRELAPDIKIIRPLLEVNRKEIEEYLRRKDIEPTKDSSNLNTDVFRNRVRHQLIPYLQKYNPQVKESLFRLAKTFRQNEEYFQHEIISILQRIALPSSGGLRINVKELLSYPEFLQYRVLREAIKKVGHDLKDIGSIHLEEIYKIIRSRKANLVYDLPHRLEVCKEYNYLKISPQKTRKLVRYQYCLNLGEELFIPEIQRSLCINWGKLSQTNYGDPRVVFMDADKVRFPLTVRNRRVGDCFHPLGLKGRKKLKDFFIDEKIPLGERERIPLLISGKDIVWVVGYRISDLVKISTHTERVLKAEVRFR